MTTANSNVRMDIGFNNAEQEQHADDEDVLAISRRLITKNRKA